MNRKNSTGSPSDKTIYDRLSRRERQIMDALFASREASVEEVRQLLPDPPSYSAVRAMLAKLEEKGHVRHVEKGLRYVYRPRGSRAKETSSALSRLVRVFYDRSAADAVTGMIDLSVDAMSDEELDRISEKIAAAKRDRGQG